MASTTLDTAEREDVWIKSTCFMCYNCCGIRAHRVNGVVVKIEGDPDCPNGWGRLCAKGNAGMMSLYDPNRTTTPLKRTNPKKGIGVDPKWVEISWEEALDTVAEKLRKIRADDPRKLLMAQQDFHAITEEAIFMVAFGTPNNWRASSYFCGNGIHPVTHLTQAAFYLQPDLNHCNYSLMIGVQGGFMTNHNALMATTAMADARMRGMKVVVVDPMAGNAASKADEWIPIRPGTDAAFALGLVNLLLNELGIYDAPFLKRYSNGPYLVGPDGRYVREEASGKPMMWDLEAGKPKVFDDPTIKEAALEGAYRVGAVEAQPAFQKLKDHVLKYGPEKVSEITTIPVDTIRRVAREYGEAARIGSTIVISGKELPYRPVAASWSRGSVGHKHAMHIGLSIQLLNQVVGAIDVPGGSLGLNARGLFWSPLEGPDGMIVSHPYLQAIPSPYPPRKVEAPGSLDLFSLFPLAPYSNPVIPLVLKEPERFNVPRPEMLFHGHTNLVHMTANPEDVAEVLKNIPFMVSFVREIDETAEFADIIFPDTHYLESLDPFPNIPWGFMEGGPGHWFWQMKVPVVQPPPGVQRWIGTVYELAHRAGFGAELNITANLVLGLRDPFKLDPKKKYSREEIIDYWARSLCGPEYGVDWFKANSCQVVRDKTVEEAYPRAFLPSGTRTPIYQEFFPRQGEHVMQVAQELGVEWDTSDYQPLPDWKPCHPHDPDTSRYDLVCINPKTPIMSFSYTLANPWLGEIGERHPYYFRVLLNRQVGESKGIKDGDEIWIESSYGDKVRGRARLTECVHPEVAVVSGSFGRTARGVPVARGKGTHFSSLLRHRWERFDMLTACLDNCVKVKVYK